jgi:hypothetical protein
MARYLLLLLSLVALVGAAGCVVEDKPDAEIEVDLPD